MEKQHPLVIVFYLDREMMGNSKIINPFAESINHMLKVKEINALAFFLPTDGEERVECINPILIKETDMDKINKIIEDIKTNFQINTDDTDKKCTCGNNGECSNCIENK